MLNRITAPLVFCLCESQKTGLVHTEGSKRRQVITFWSCEELHGQTHKVIIVSHRLALGSHFLLVLSPGELAGPAFYSFFFAFLTSAIKKKKKKNGIQCMYLCVPPILHHFCPDGTALLQPGKCHLSFRCDVNLASSAGLCRSIL